MILGFEVSIMENDRGNGFASEKDGYLIGGWNTVFIGCSSYCKCNLSVKSVVD